MWFSHASQWDLSWLCRTISAFISKTEQARSDPKAACGSGPHGTQHGALQPTLHDHQHRFNMMTPNLIHKQRLTLAESVLHKRPVTALSLMLCSDLLEETEIRIAVYKYWSCRQTDLTWILSVLCFSPGRDPQRKPQPFLHENSSVYHTPWTMSTLRYTAISHTTTFD